jgi:hypothetical protein
MNKKTIKSLSLGLGVLGVAFLISPITGSADDASDAIADALSAAWPGMAENATVVDWEGNVLREGSNGYTCYGRTRKTLRPIGSESHTCSRGTRVPAISILSPKVPPMIMNGSSRGRT